MNGQKFPPTSGNDIRYYDHDEVIRGYSDWRKDDLAPGPNHPPAYRWGWQNRQRDHQSTDDGFDAVRFQYFEQTRKR